VLQHDVLADTVLRERASAAVDGLVQAHGYPVERAQVAGLRQVAANEPRLLKGFADKQKERADKRYQETRRQDFEHESRFWELVADLCAGSQPRHPWSLAQEAEAALPPELRDVRAPAGGKQSAAEQAALRTRRDERQQRLQAWFAWAYPAFFQHFCAHYLYRMST
jgi:hypothetical protein